MEKKKKKWKNTKVQTTKSQFFEVFCGVLGAPSLPRGFPVSEWPDLMYFYLCFKGKLILPGNSGGCFVQGPPALRQSLDSKRSRQVHSGFLVLQEGGCSPRLEFSWLCAAAGAGIFIGKKGFSHSMLRENTEIATYIHILVVYLWCVMKNELQTSRAKRVSGIPDKYLECKGFLG